MHQGNLCKDQFQNQDPTDKRRQKVDQLSDVDCVPTNTHILLKSEPQLYIFLKTMKLSSKKDYQKTKSNDETRVQNPQSCVRLVVRQNQFRTQNPNQNVDTTNQLADILTNGSFSRDEWNHLLRLFNIMNFSMYSCSHFSYFLSDDQVRKQSAMSKRGQKTTSAEVGNVLNTSILKQMC